MTFVESRLLPKPATNRQQSQLLPIRSTLSPVCTGPKRHGRLCQCQRQSGIINVAKVTKSYYEDHGGVVTERALQ